MTDYHFDEAVFYGRIYYQNSAYYIDKENWLLVANDINNFVLSNPSKLKEDLDVQSKIIILFENCFDKNKKFDPIIDISKYNFYLNKNKINEVISYIYPYSYEKKGTSLLKFKPLYFYDPYRQNEKTIRTGDDFLTCVRTLLFTEETLVRKGKNYFRVLTASNTNLEYFFIYDNGFIDFSDERSSMKIVSPKI
ncbi:hypothetical protein [Leptospira paudalimensis]|uniref:Uncharacterized protein n=1 Tax=Leptospira paudalimensis TaxID=2950024 RepID=A0ABT3M663_9LEPT|nr:hypothetical protein [Leptospira paudalimensis]MCW7503879.1 hypothetical protein [Leptospira paudalimensis]